MSVKYALVIALALGGCRERNSPPAQARTAVTAAPAVGEGPIPQVATPAPKLPPPPPAQRARVVITAPAIDDCEGVKVRVYADGVRRSCMTVSELRPGKAGHVVITCGANAELPAERPLALELRYERAGLPIARLPLGERTLDVGDQTLTAAGLRGVTCPVDHG